mmetsp:Transcript_31389/g.96902  ORF Transcript_31389/g.96902 Transcript_31389/m.96902 type:complete len:81 (+) Transcript_31389:201-443(+)
MGRRASFAADTPHFGRRRSDRAWHHPSDDYAATRPATCILGGDSCEVSKWPSCVFGLAERSRLGGRRRLTVVAPRALPRR